MARLYAFLILVGNILPRLYVKNARAFLPVHEKINLTINQFNEIAKSVKLSLFS